jgi:tetratricopeptide (TPR) repeat protein
VKQHRSEKSWRAQIAEFHRLIAEQPNNGNVWLDYAQFLEKECDNPELVVTAYENVQRLRPQVDCRAKLGTALVRAGRPEEGLSLLQARARENPTAPVYSALGSALLKMEQFASSRAAFEKAIELEPEFEEAHYLLGEAIRMDPAYPQDEKWTQGLAAYREAVRLDGNYQLAWQALGLLLSKKSQTLAEGIAALDRAVALDPADGWSYIFLANAYWKSENIDKANQCYIAAINAFPGDQYFQDCYREFLDSLESLAPQG